MMWETERVMERETRERETAERRGREGFVLGMRVRWARGREKVRPMQDAG